ncbi:hypothetical protein QE428_001300 [Microbacterium sp. SORGH_AS 505]|nr:hypothetical protein [Microbacterium sp. SORGH_AS_0505]
MNVDASAIARASERPVLQYDGCRGQRRWHLRTPGVPDRRGLRPRQHGIVRPLPIRAVGHRGDTRGELTQRRRCRSVGTGFDTSRQTEHSLSRGIRPVRDEPRRDALAVRGGPPAVRRQDLTVQRIQREVEAVVEERGESGVLVLEGGVPLAEGPQRPREPVTRTAVGRIRQLDRLGGRVEGAVGLHPQDDVAGIRSVGRLEVRDRPQQLVRLVATVVVAGLLEVADVDDRGARDVVGVVGALPPVPGLGVEGSAADPFEGPAVTGIGVRPRHDERRLLSLAVSAVPVDVLRRGGLVEEEVEVRQVGDGCGCRGGDGGGDTQRDGERERGQRGESDGARTSLCGGGHEGRSFRCGAECRCRAVPDAVRATGGRLNLHSARDQSVRSSRATPIFESAMP